VVLCEAITLIHKVAGGHTNEKRMKKLITSHKNGGAIVKMWSNKFKYIELLN
jgi:hypothetical protein